MLAPLDPHLSLFGRWLFGAVCVLGLWAALWAEGRPQRVWQGTASTEDLGEVIAAVLFGGVVLALCLYNAAVLAGSGVLTLP